MDRRIHLKIKIKSLAEEARIIKSEAARVSKRIKNRQLAGSIKHTLNAHRKGIVRDEARHSLLAYAVLRGKPYEIVEKKCYEQPKFEYVAKMARKFGFTDEIKLAIWINDAKHYLKKELQAEAA